MTSSAHQAGQSVRMMAVQLEEEREMPLSWIRSYESFIRQIYHDFGQSARTTDVIIMDRVVGNQVDRMSRNNEHARPERLGPTALDIEFIRHRDDSLSESSATLSAVSTQPSYYQALRANMIRDRGQADIGSNDFTIQSRDTIQASGRPGMRETLGGPCGNRKNMDTAPSPPTMNDKTLILIEEQPKDITAIATSPKHQYTSMDLQLPNGGCLPHDLSMAGASDNRPKGKAPADPVLLPEALAEVVGQLRVNKRQNDHRNEVVVTINQAQIYSSFRVVWYDLHGNKVPGRDSVRDTSEIEFLPDYAEFEGQPISTARRMIVAKIIEEKGWSTLARTQYYKDQSKAPKLQDRRLSRQRKTPIRKNAKDRKRKDALVAWLKGKDGCESVTSCINCEATASDCLVFRKGIKIGSQKTPRPGYMSCMHCIDFGLQ